MPIASNILDLSRNRGTDMIWNNSFGLIVEMFANGDNGEIGSCRQNIKNCQHREDKKRKATGGDTEAKSWVVVFGDKRKATISKQRVVP